MATNRTSITTFPQHVSDFLFSPLFRFFTEPHRSVTEVGEKRRAQLLATITLILVAAFTWVLFSNPTALGTFAALYALTLIAYVLSRSPYYHVGAYFFSYGITSLAFLSLYFGTASSFDSAITNIAHIS